MLIHIIPHHLVEGSSPINIEALQQLMRDDDSFGLCIAGNADPLSILLGCLTPVTISKASISLIEQVADQLGQKALNVEWKKYVRNKKA